MSETKKKIVKNVSSTASDDSKSGAKHSAGSALKTVKLRNRFFFMLYRYTSIGVLLSIANFIFAFILLIVFIRSPVPPQYIPIDEGGKYIKLEPLSVCREEAEVKRFVLGATKRLYKYDYINYADQIQDAAPFFTGSGWNEYLDENARSKTLFAVKENKWIVTVQPSAVPLVTKKEIIDDVCSWDTKTQIEVSYVGPSGQVQRGDLYMRIVRVSVINNPDGLGITRAVFVETKNN